MPVCCIFPNTALPYIQEPKRIISEGTQGGKNNRGKTAGVETH